MQPHSEGVGVRALPRELGSSQFSPKSLGMMRNSGPREGPGPAAESSWQAWERSGGLQADPLQGTVHVAVQGVSGLCQVGL